MGLFEKFHDAGVLISYPLLVIIITLFILFFRALPKQNRYDKTITILISLGWFAIAWGYMGRTIGLIEAFDKVAASGEISPSMLSSGLKKAILGPLMGIISFLISRSGVLILQVLKKKQSSHESVK